VIAVVLLTIAWGAFAFGAVYPWAYWPMFASSVAIGVAGLIARRNRRPSAPELSGPAAALAFLAVCIAAQLVPMPAAVIQVLSPGTDALLRQHDLAYAGGLSIWHTLSIDRHSTLLAFAAFVSLAVLTIGLASALSPSRVMRLVQGIAAIGLVLAIAALVQRSTGTLKIYGFWSPIHHPYQIYGPFVNHNHFAGWMVMAIPLVLAAVIGELARASGRAMRDWRSRILWIGSPEGSRAAFMVTAVLAMGVALLLTMSRSGVIAFSATIVILALALMRGGAYSRRLRMVALSTVAIVAIGIFSWIGIEPIAHRFATGESIAGRLPGWRGAMAITSAFPLLGSGLNTYKTAMIYHSTRKPGDKYWDTAHNDYLQVASEGGLLLLIPIAACVWLSGRQMAGALKAERDPQVEWIRIGAVAGLIGIGLQELVDFSLQLPGIALFFAVVCAIAIHVPRSESSSRRRRVSHESAVPGMD
jgi:O-antigen ligase